MLCRLVKEMAPLAGLPTIEGHATEGTAGGIELHVYPDPKSPDISYKLYLTEQGQTKETE